MSIMNENRLRAFEWYEWDDRYCVEFVDGSDFRSGRLSEESLTEIRSYLDGVGLTKVDIDDAVFAWGLVLSDKSVALLCYLNYR